MFLKTIRGWRGINDWPAIGAEVLSCERFGEGKGVEYLTTFRFRIDCEAYWGDFKESIPHEIFARGEIISIHYNPADPNESYYPHALMAAERRVVNMVSLALAAAFFIADLLRH